MELVLQAVPIKHGLKSQNISYVSSLLFGDIVRLLDDGHLYVPNDPELPDFAQRKLNSTRVKAIAQYILNTYQDGTTFFPPICINLQPSPTYREGQISVPYYSATLRLTDGQHRCFGVRQALQSIQNQSSMNTAMLSQLELGVLIYAGLPLDQERQAFRDQNLLVQRPTSSLSHYFDQRSPVVLIAKKLLQQVPQFHNNVEIIEHSLGQHNPKLLTLSTLVQATQFMFPNLSTHKNIQQLADWATEFWMSVASILPNDPWNIQTSEKRRKQRKTLLTVSAVFFQALGALAHDLYLEDVPAEELTQWLKRIQEIDWQRENPFLLERGVVCIGVVGEPIISNTRTTVEACHRVLQEFIGVVPVIH